jgi:hypothetical protein
VRGPSSDLCRVNFFISIVELYSINVLLYAFFKSCEVCIMCYKIVTCRHVNGSTHVFS